MTTSRYHVPEYRRDTDAIGIYDLSKSYYRKGVKDVVFQNFSLEIKKGETVSILGASGCGKTTLLNIIAGIDREYECDAIRIAAQRKGYMFQTDQLLPWRRAQKNALLGIEMLGSPVTPECLKSVSTYFRKFGLTKDDERKYPRFLSGGMRQRVALIRTLLYDPDILLLDEPFYALDYHTKHFMEQEVLKFALEKERTIIFVTHDPGEAVAVGSRLVVLKRRTQALEPTQIVLNKNVSFASDVGGRDPVAVRKDHMYSEYFESVLNALENG